MTSRAVFGQNGAWQTQPSLGGPCRGASGSPLPDDNMHQKFYRIAVVGTDRLATLHRASLPAGTPRCRRENRRMAEL